MAVEGRVDVVGIGANSVDYVAVLPEFPQPSAARSKLPIRRHAIMCGGQMATALATCARLGLRARYLGAVGDDANGELVRQALGQLDVDVSRVATRRAANQFAFVLIDERSGERVIFWDRDERLRLDDSDLPEEAIVSARLVHVDDTDERAAIAAARIGRAHGIPVTSDIDRLTGRTAELIDAVTVAILAESVPLELAGRRTDTAASAEELADLLRSMPRRSEQVLCATLGSRGAVAIDRDGVHYQPGYAVPVTDTTGAGDVFRGALIFARLKGWAPDEQLRFANAAAAVSCTRLGALGGVPSLEEVEKVVRGGSGL